MTGTDREQFITKLKPRPLSSALWCDTWDKDTLQQCI